jgi:hypothetical protein
MKRIIAMMIPALLLSCRWGLVKEAGRPEFPPLPGAWDEILGASHWRLEWVSPRGGWETLDLSGGEEPELSFYSGAATAVIARPYWPEKGIEPGLARPAGAILPYDLRDGKIDLSWRGGVEAVFYRDLAAGALGGQRFPWHFNWPWFRELLEEEELRKTLGEDLWRIDWETVTGKTLERGFNRRYLSPGPGTPAAIPGHPGRWAPASPFAPLLEAEPGEPLLVTLGAGVETWFSAGGFLRVSQNGHVYRGYPPPKEE